MFLKKYTGVEEVKSMTRYTCFPFGVCCLAFDVPVLFFVWCLAVSFGS